MSGATPRVERVVVRRLAAELERPFRSGIHAISTMHNVVVSAEAGGETGLGYTFGFLEADALAVRELTTALAAELPGAEIDRVREHWDAAWARSNFIGHGGPATMALAAVDTALWDLRARLRGISLARLLGAAAAPRPAYASGGSLSLSGEELVEEALLRREQGYAGFKFRVGSPDLAPDVERTAALRDALGEFPLMADANQGWDRPTAARALRALAPYELDWLEEPLDAEDVAGLAALRARGEVPIAAGESVYGPAGIHALLEAGAVDVIQPDLMRCGGVTAMIAAGALASAYRVPVSPHLFAESAPHLMAALPTAASVECFPGWFDHLFGPSTVRDGRIMSSEKGGLGVALSAAAEELTLERREFV